MPNLELQRKDDVSSFRKIAIGTWSDAYDPSVYGTMELKMDKAMQYLNEYRQKTGRKLTVSHMLAKVAAMSPHHLQRIDALEECRHFGGFHHAHTVRHR